MDKLTKKKSVAAWQAKLERGLAETLSNPENYIQTVQKFTASLSKNRIIIEGDNGDGLTEFVDAVMLDSEYLALFEYEDDLQAGTRVVVLHIADSGTWKDDLAYYAGRDFDPEDIEKLKTFHQKYLKQYQGNENS